MEPSLLVMRLSNGVNLFTNSSTESLEKYAKEKELKTIRVFLAVHPNNEMEYLIVKGTNPVYSSKSYEDIAVHLDIMSLLKGGKGK